MHTYIESTVLVTDVCASCGVLFAMPERLNREFRDTGRNFYCPSGHSLSYGKGQNQRLQDELAATKRTLENNRAFARSVADQLGAAERSNRALRGANTRIRNRAGKGMCPAKGCRRHFANVAAHVARQHPDFEPSNPDGGADG